MSVLRLLRWLPVLGIGAAVPAHGQFAPGAAPAPTGEGVVPSGAGPQLSAGGRALARLDTVHVVLDPTTQEPRFSFRVAVPGMAARDLQDMVVEWFQDNFNVPRKRLTLMRNRRGDLVVQGRGMSKRQVDVSRSNQPAYAPVPIGYTITIACRRQQADVTISELGTLLTTPPIPLSGLIRQGLDWENPARVGVARQALETVDVARELSAQLRKALTEQGAK